MDKDKEKPKEMQEKGKNHERKANMHLGDETGEAGARRGGKYTATFTPSRPVACYPLMQPCGSLPVLAGPGRIADLFSPRSYDPSIHPNERTRNTIILRCFSPCSWAPPGRIHV